MKPAQSMSKEEKQDKVFRVFEEIAKGYDRANVRISLGMQDAWKRMLIREITGEGAGRRACRQAGRKAADSHSGRMRVLDLCTGTGDIALGIAGAGTKYDVTGMDFSPSMLRVAASKAKKRGLSGIRWRRGNAMRIPYGDAYFDAVSISFGLRNCADPEQVLRESFRVLRPGGRFLCLDSFVPESAVVRPFYRLYFGSIMPLLGGGTAHRSEYEWLQESTERFLGPSELADRMRAAGFERILVRRRMMGACVLLVGHKPQGCSPKKTLNKVL